MDQKPLAPGFLNFRFCSLYIHILSPAMATFEQVDANQARLMTIEMQTILVASRRQPPVPGLFAFGRTCDHSQKD